MSVRTTRRDIFKLLAAGAAGAALSTTQVYAQSDAPSEVDVHSPKWRRLLVGDTVFTLISDGVSQYDLHPTFGKDQSVEAVQAVAEENYLPVDGVKMNLNVLVAEIGDDVVMFDTGIGEFGKDYGLGLLLPGLEQAGYSAEDVTVVLVTHMHIDHIGGLMSGGKPIFPNARYVLGKAEYEYWTSEAAKTGARPETIEFVANYVTPLIDKATLVVGDEEAVPGVKTVESFGHSPGHLCFEVTTSAGPVLVTGDVLLHHVFAFEEPAWTTDFDGDATTAAETRVRLLADLAARRIPFFAFHLPLPGLGYVQSNGEAYRYIAASYQFADA